MNDNVQGGILVKQAELIIPRLEKITPDSSWAHKASGCRGTLIRFLAIQKEPGRSTTTEGDISRQLNGDDLIDLRNVLECSYDILECAAAERLR